MVFRNLFEHPLSLLILILVIVLLLGWKKLPDMARSLGRSSRILKSEIDEMKNESKTKSSAADATVEGEKVADVPTTGRHSSGSTVSDERRDI